MHKKVTKVASCSFKKKVFTNIERRYTVPAVVTISATYDDYKPTRRSVINLTNLPPWERVPMYLKNEARDISKFISKLGMNPNYNDYLPFSYLN